MFVLLMLVSAGIEYVQYHFHMGLPKTDDIIHDSLGALLGVIACAIPVKPRRWTYPLHTETAADGKSAAV